MSSSSLSSVGSAPQVLNPNFTINFKKEASKNSMYYGLLRTAAVVAYVATVAIAAAVLTFSFLASGGTVLPFVMIGIAAAAIPLGWAGSKLWQISNNFKSKANEARGIEQATNEVIARLKDESGQIVHQRIVDGLAEYGIQHLDETWNLIKAQLPRKEGQAPATENESLEAMIPVLGQLNFWVTHMHATLVTSHNMRTQKAPKQNIQMDRDKEAYGIYEGATLPSLLKASLMVEILANPFSPVAKLSDLGNANIKTLELRINDSLYRRDDRFFLFNDKERRAIPYRLLDDHVHRLMRDQLAEANREISVDAVHKNQVQALQLVRSYLFDPTVNFYPQQQPQPLMSPSQHGAAPMPSFDSQNAV
ncbi:MAG: hypothetical protein JSS32_05780 [Verrucomicrobia bacterium]|nr:hypothetical protein [Verrucomicrobiota bacterium]